MYVCMYVFVCLEYFRHSWCNCYYRKEIDKATGV